MAHTIADIGHTDYYRSRTAFAASATAAPPELQLYHNDDARFALEGDGDRCAAILSVDGIRCAACVWLIERQLLRLPGVQAASLNVATEKLHVRWHKDECSPGAILQAIHQVGYAAYPYDAVRHGEQLQRTGKTLGRQLFVAGLSMMQVMMYVAPSYLAEDGTLEHDMASLMRWASLLLTLPAVCYSAQPFFKGAWNSVRNRALGMDVPVALGIAAAFGASLLATWRGDGAVYFDSATMFIFLLLCSRYLELLARRKAAGALERLQHALPASASRLDDFPASRASTLVAAATLAAGDFILARPGDAIAADSIIVEGDGILDLSLLSGESAPQHKAAGDQIPGGAINTGAALVLRVLKAARDSTLADLLKLVQRAGAGKPHIAQWADRTAAWFVACLLLFALASFGFWQWHDAARAWPVAIAVLVVSCPCALSLATPSALAAATDRLLGRGVLIVRPHVLETLHRASHVVFDKTGTLTLGKPVLRHIEPAGGTVQRQCLRIAAALEAGSGHPLAHAIIDAARAGGVEPDWHAENVAEIPGMGIEGRLYGRCYRLGNATFVAGLAGDPLAETDAPPGMTALYLGCEERWLARFLLSDALRDDAQATVDYFRKAGKQVILLSGDQQALSDGVARELGMSGARGGCLPDQKLHYVQQLQREGAVVAMVGDGINDAAVLGAADVSFAMGGGAALAQAQADGVLLSGRLSSLMETARSAGKTMRVIRQNLAWAMLYNLTAIPAAAFGYLNPWLSGLGMALSSAVVIANALRLRRG
ncbi:heavy metal translocating P-type ATPase family protein [Janthinobacterium agaricidamnosum NBRC 102515 = DSM 9628]|uniref:Heavy metal translocating P-type ATPase family protein n=1 Tax=Janthinobacterium agaricidamnosum NBRC 102515 = DSM 9628 TaxID=1349767 RepID=W0VEC0_9BURK|nr:heavy metal translocating P-type ATPase family protein [Janthinobacterium agaricidamnosum NBRC 102515 = DSM 9628]